LISAIGEIRQARAVGAGRELEIAVPWTSLVPGESVAVDGACLTVEQVIPGGFTVHLITTTLERTRFGSAAPGDRCNLERALQVGERLGGHLVQGHVDGVGRVLVNGPGPDWRLVIELPADLAPYMAPKGSVCVDGVSLTLAAVHAEQRRIDIALIPATLDKTTLRDLRPGDGVNIEADPIAKTVVHYLRAFGAGSA
jgi:riboflavin synthase